MLENILKLEGVSVLDKKQQEKVNGGQTCKITLLQGGTSIVQFRHDFSEGALGSEEANNYCVSNVINNGWDRCFYDCEWDDLVIA